MRLKRNNKGFTLVELMAVIAIIMILIGLLMPALQTARKQARKAQTLSRLRQVGIAMHSYAMDNDGKFPNAIADLTPDTGTKYLEDNTVTYSPFDTTAQFTIESAAAGKVVENLPGNTAVISYPHTDTGTYTLYADGHVALGSD